MQTLTPPDPPTESEQFGRTLGSAGDVNGDGYGDLLLTTTQIHAYVFLGGPDGLREDLPARIIRIPLKEMDAGLASSACDFNGDGFGDVLIGSPSESQQRGRAYVYFGGSTGLSGPTTLALPPDQSSLYLGWSTTAQDLDGDGYCDAIVSGTQSVYVFFGSSAGIASAPGRTLTVHALDFFVANAGDIDGDGYGDVVTGGQGATGLGVTFGGRFATALVKSTRPGFAWEVAGLGDLDGDGFGDVAASTFISDSGGPVYIYSGKQLANNMPDAGATLLEPPTSGSGYFGYSLAGIH
jgi:hypothetical protein